jgi:hypothetical protein
MYLGLEIGTTATKAVLVDEHHAIVATATAGYSLYQPTPEISEFDPQAWIDAVRSVEHVDRRYFELCVFSNVMLELKSGDLCVPGSDQFSDYRKELVSKDEFERGVALYGEQAGIPVIAIASQTDLRLPDAGDLQAQHRRSQIGWTQCRSGYARNERLGLDP